MRHRKAGSKLNRNSSHRKAMFRNMVTSLLKHDRIRTTDVRAKILRGWADHIITLAKRGDLHARRQALAIVREKDVVHKLFDEAGTRFAAAAGGYTRIVKLGYRPGDAARMALIELVDHSEVAPKKKSKKRPAKKKTKAVVTATSEEVAVEAAAEDIPEETTKDAIVAESSEVAPEDDSKKADAASEPSAEDDSPEDKPQSD